MMTISVPIIRRISVKALGIFVLTAAGIVGAYAKNNCADNFATINPARLAQSGIGGTGTPVAGSGIGGTGLHDGGMGGTGKPESGIGGTGSMVDVGGIGGTGIVGVITGFASICVNGIEVHYDNQTPISIDGRASTMAELAVGQVVATRAVGTGDELTAQNIAVIHAVVGPISEIAAETNEMRVLDQPVHVANSANHEWLASFKQNDWVRVSGHRLANGTIMASRIEMIEPLAEVKINGHVAQTDDQGFVVDGTRVRYDAAETVVVSQGMEVQVVGQWDGVQLHAQQVFIEPIRVSLGDIEHLVIEGYIHTRDNKEFNLGGRVFTQDSRANTASGAIKEDLKVDQLVQISGKLNADQPASVGALSFSGMEMATLTSVPDRGSIPLIDMTGSLKKENGDLNPGDSRVAGTETEKATQQQDNAATTVLTDTLGHAASTVSIDLLDRAGRESGESKSSDEPERLGNGEFDALNLSRDHHDQQRDIDQLRDIPRNELLDHIRDFSGFHDRIMDR